jgi:hypothetical protein
MDEGDVEFGFVCGEGVVSVGDIDTIALIVIVNGGRHGVVLWRKWLIIKLAIN